VNHLGKKEKNEKGLREKPSNSHIENPLTEKRRLKISKKKKRKIHR